MALNCPKCTDKMRVVRSQTADNLTQRWYRCPACNELCRTVETIYLSKPVVRLGSETPNAKLNEEKVRILRAECDAGATYESVAERFDVEPRAIRLAHRRKTWAHVV